LGKVVIPGAGVVNKVEIAGATSWGSGDFAFDLGRRSLERHFGDGLAVQIVQIPSVDVDVGCFRDSWALVSGR
jgi:hypothetical protein